MKRGSMGQLAAVVLILGVALPAASAPGSFEVALTETGGVPRAQQPVAFSFPLPEGAVTDLAHIRVMDGDDEMTADLRALKNWPDASIKWARAEVVVGQMSAGAKRTVTVNYGGATRRAATDELSVREGDNRVTVDNGLLEVTIGARGIESLALAGRTLATGDAVRVVDAEGTVYDGWGGSPTVTVKRRGAAAVEVDVAGASSPPFNFRSRYTIYRDCPAIRRQTFIESAEERDVQLVTVNALRPAGEMDAVTVLERAPVAVPVTGGAAVYWQMTVPQPETWLLAEIGQDGAAEIRATFEADPAESPIMGVRGERPGYFIDVSGPGGGLTLAGEVRQWGRDAGLSYVATEDGPELAINAHGMWPEHQGDIYNRNWRWHEGVAKNFETFIIAHEGPYCEQVRDAALATYRALYAMPDPAHVRATGVFGMREDGLEFEANLEPVRRWVGLAQISIAEYEKLTGDKRAERTGGLISGEVYRAISSKSGGGGDPNRAMNDTRHWFAEAYRKGDGALLRDSIEIAYAEMDHAMYHVGDPDKVGKNHYHGRWSTVSSGDYGCRGFACELAYLATGDDYFLDAWNLELGALMRTTSWSSRSAGYTMVSMIWAYERFGDHKYLDKANEAFAYALPRQRPDGATTQGLNNRSSLKPWMMGIVMGGTLELHRVDPSDEKLGFLTRIADYLLANQMPDGSWLYTVGGKDRPWKQGAGTATLAPQLIRVYELTGELRYLASAQRGVIWLLNTADPDTWVVRARNAPGNTWFGNPSHTTCSYVFSTCGRLSDVCRRAGLPFVVDLPTPLAEQEHWGVTAITELAPKTIVFEVALPEETGGSEVTVAGFAPGEALVVELDGVARELTADESGSVVLAVPASEHTTVAIRAAQ